MAEKVWRNCGVYFKGHDFTPDLNNITLNISQDMPDATVFGSTWRKKKVGLGTADFTMSGFYNAATGPAGVSSGGVDAAAFQEVAGTTGALSLLTDGTGLGEVAYFTEAIGGEYNPSGSIGDMFGFTWNLYSNSGNVIRGHVMEAGSMSTSVTGTSRNLGTGSTESQKLYAALHLLSSTGGRINIAIIGSSESNYGSQTTMISFHSSSPGTDQIKSTGVSSTKITHYKIVFYTTAGSTDCSFNGLAVAGIK